MQPKSRKHPGIEVRRTRSGPSYRAEVFDHRTGKRRYKAFPTLAAAKGWRTDALAAIRAGTLAPDAGVTLRQAAAELLDGMEAGTIRSRSGRPYKPATCRSYRRAFRLRLLPAFGPRRLGDIRRRDVQAFIDRMAAEGHDGSTIRNTIDPLRVVYRRALTRELVTVNPMVALEIPAATGKRDRIASPDEATSLIAALPEGDRALWATAMFAGLRRGELRGLRWSDVDLAGGVIRVERGWDAKEGAIEGKTKASRRTVPIAGRLRDHLLEHKLATGREGDALAFGVTATDPLEPSNVRRRALTAWKAAKLKPISLHECRHTFASLGIAAGLNAKALSEYLGHASVTITFDRYGHLFPGSEHEAAGQLDAYLLRSEGHSRGSEGHSGPDSTGDNRNYGEAATPDAERDSAL
jgi:integrase